MQKWIILVVVCIIIIIGAVVALNCNVENEYVPEAEIEDKELRKTMVSLYFQDKISKELVKETRLIDSKNLLREPYQELLNMLIRGPENTNYEKMWKIHKFYKRKNNSRRNENIRFKLKFKYTYN